MALVYRINYKLVDSNGKEHVGGTLIDKTVAEYAIELNKEWKDLQFIYLEQVDMFDAKETVSTDGSDIIFISPYAYDSLLP